MIITENAASRIKAINEENKTESMLRIAVQGGGCGGFQYRFLMDDAVLEEDHVFEKNHACVVIDAISLDLLKDAILDFQEDLAGSMFVIKNPQAKSGCGCGNSFSL